MLVISVHVASSLHDPSNATMLVQQMLIDNETMAEKESLHHFTPTIQKLSKSDVHFPLTSPRKRAPSITSISDLPGQDVHTIGRLTIRARDQSPSVDSGSSQEDEIMEGDTSSRQQLLSLHDLPLEVQNRVLDEILGEVHAVNAATTSLRGSNVSHSMRHPRRKAVSELALVSTTWRNLVQERIYRHIKIKGTRTGLAESEDYFSQHPHLAKHVRHIEFWVPVWGDKAAYNDHNGAMQRMNHMGITYGDENLITTHDLLGFNFKLSVYSATLSEILQHTKSYFPEARIFTLEGGHCKKSNMIRHFPAMLFGPSEQQLIRLPNIRTLAMRGAWNIMRNYGHWETIQQAFPNVEEWHCSYAKPRQEAYTTINEILLRLPTRLRHIDISLDGMYSKDDTTLGSNSLLSGMHLCEQLGRVAPHLESLSYTGKICECFWHAAAEEAIRMKAVKLDALELVVKSCCRQRVKSYHQDTGETIVEEIGGIMADGAGITNLIFIKAFERLVLGTVDALPYLLSLGQIRIRYIDLDSPCALLNPYWHLKGPRVYGIWNEEIVERLSEVRSGTVYEELGDGLSTDLIESVVKKEEEPLDWRNPNGVIGGGGSVSTTPNNLYPKRRPLSIKTSSYRVIAEARGS